MTYDLYTRAEELLRGIGNIIKFATKTSIYPQKEGSRIVQELYALSEGIPAREHPTTQEELFQGELKRRSHGEAQRLEGFLQGDRAGFNKVLEIYNIPEEDISMLRPWLEQTRPAVIESVDRIFHTMDIRNYEWDLRLDIPEVRSGAEGTCATHIKRYHNAMGELFKQQRLIAKFVARVGASPTNAQRSYFSSQPPMVAIAIPAVCYQDEDGVIQIRDREMIRLFGYESMGHGLNHVITQESALPYFLKWHSQLTEGSAESVAQFYQRQLFETIKDNPRIQEKLRIRSEFEKIYQEATDLELIETYGKCLFQYAVCVLSDKSHGPGEDPQAIKRRIALIEPLEIRPYFATRIVESNKDNYDADGNLSPSIVSELRYTVRAVERARQAFERAGIAYTGQGRDLIDQTFLTGYWTPQGFVDHARLAAQDKTKG